MNHLTHILQQQQLFSLYQPILNLQDGKFLGFEGLIRGPADSILHAPANLFAAAKQHRLELETETACRRKIMSSFMQQGLPGLLFLNVTPETLQHPSFKSGETLNYLKQIGLNPSQVVIEITENQPIYDFKVMRDALCHYREMGFRIAIDDLGEGFSSLRLWSELRPDFVKIDMHFVQGVDQDPVKKQFLKSIYEIACKSKTEVIAEGVETLPELLTIKEIGITYCQGYLIARPNATPPLQAELTLQQACQQPKIQFKPTSSTQLVRRCELLARYIEPAYPKQPTREIKARFEQDDKLHSIPVIKNNKPVGQINRNTALAETSKNCAEWMSTEPLVVDKETSIHELSNYLGTTSPQSLASGFIITQQGNYLGMGNTHDLLSHLNMDYQQASQQAHYLTQLPGQLPIYQKIQELINNKQAFTLCYADIKNLKQFCKTHDYHKGEAVICAAAQYLNNSIDLAQDFIGHFSDDDFVLIFQSNDWQNRCNRAIHNFTLNINNLLKQHPQNTVLPTLFIGATSVNSQQQISAHYQLIDLAREALNQAKELNHQGVWQIKSSAAFN